MTINQNDLLKNIIRAENYFSDPISPPLAQSLSFSPLHNQNISDIEGLVQFIIASPRPFELAEIEQMNELKDIQIALISIMANHLSALQHHDSEAYYQPEHWLDTLNHLPLLGRNKVETKRLDKQTFDFSVAQAFVQLLLGAAINAASPSLNDFIEFLRRQGQQIELGLRKSFDAFKTITVAGVTEVLTHNNQLIFVPKLKIMSLRFSHQSAKMLMACCTGNKFTLSLEYTTITSVFDVGALNDPVINERFYQFLNKYRQLGIEKSDAFFSGDFYLQ